MEKADFLHLVRLSELDAGSNPARYRRAVWCFAGLGYLYVLAMLSCGLVLFGIGIDGFLHAPRGSGWMLLFAASGLALVWSGLAALWLRLNPPQGIAIGAADAPALFEALQRIRTKVRGPRLHEVLLTGDMNASITQVPRWGLLGGNRNYLAIGLPLVMALDERRLLTVLAHEYGHLRGDHGRLSAWVYRTRHAWTVLADRAQSGEGLANALTQRFLGWYFPRFIARTFAMARQDEYEADRTAQRLLGPEATGAALVEIEVKSRWLDQRFWRDHWAGAVAAPAPAMLPLARMAEQVHRIPEPAFAADALREALRRLSSYDDTHPVLRDRLDAIGVKPVLPAWSQRGSLALLGAAAQTAIAELDRRWWSDARAQWQAAHAQAQEDAVRRHELGARGASASVDELLELAELCRRLDPDDGGEETQLRIALGRSPEHPRVLSALAQWLIERKSSEALDLLETLHHSSPGQAYPACRMALALADTVEIPVEQRRLWRGRLEPAEQREKQAWEEFAHAHPLQDLLAHGLDAGSLKAVRAELIRTREVRRAWLARRSVSTFPDRAYYLVFVELALHATAALEQSCQALWEQLPLPGPRRVVFTGTELAPDVVEQACGVPVYRRR